MANLKYIDNPPNPFQNQYVEWCDEPPVASLQIFEEEAKSILAKNDSADISFTYSVNPYRGCFHSCAYCYARSSHHYLQFGAGTDFDRKIVAKVNAPELLVEAFRKKSWSRESIVFSGNTDCYQPVEIQYQLTKRCLEVCTDWKNPFCIISKGAIIRRDIELLSKASEKKLVYVVISLAFADDEMSKLVEPHAPRPSHRFETIRLLSEAGIPVGLALAPVIPGLNDTQIPAILERAAGAGASNAFMTLLRLPGATRDIFIERMTKAFPTKIKRMIHSLRDMKEGQLNRPDFGKRMVGEGSRWQAIDWMFRESCRKYGLSTKERTLMKPEAPLQLTLGM